MKIQYPTLTGSRASVASEVKVRRSGQLPNLYRMLLHSPPVAKGWLGLGTAIRYETLLPPELRELAICLVATLTGSNYEWHHHAPLALDVGATEDQLQALRERRFDETFDEGTAQALKHVSAVVLGTYDGSLPPELTASYGERAVIELTALAGYYTGVSRFIAALGIQIESDDALANETTDADDHQAEDL